MRIGSWNCKLALDHKWARLQALGPDLAIVRECASPAILAGRGVDLDSTRCLWAAKSTARDANKGLGVFAGEGVEIGPAPLWPEIVGRWAEHLYRLDVLLPFEVIRASRLHVWPSGPSTTGGGRGEAGCPARSWQPPRSKPPGRPPPPVGLGALLS
jgi:hypothetical protein